MAIDNKQYNLFGKPAGNAAGTGAVSPTTSYNIENSNIINTKPNVQGNVEQLRGGRVSRTIGATPGAVSVTPDVSANVDAKKNQLLDSFRQQQEAQKNAYVPDSENKGRGVANWISRVFSSPKVQTKEGSRRAQQNIAVLGDTLRHLANLWYVGKKDASPQTIQSQSAINDAKWKAEDALEAQQEKAAREWALKQQAAADKKAYQMGQLQLGKERNDISLGNLAINQGRFGLESEKQGWKREDRPIEQATLAAGLEQKKAVAKKATIEADQAKAMGDAKLALLDANRKRALAGAYASYASAKRSNASTNKIRIETSNLLKGTGNFVLSGNRGSFSRKKAATSAEKANIIKRLHEIGVVSDAEYNSMNNSANIALPGQNSVKLKQDDIIANALNSVGDDVFVRDIFESNGFTYHDYTPATKKYNPQK